MICPFREESMIYLPILRVMLSFFFQIAEGHNQVHYNSKCEDYNIFLRFFVKKYTILTASFLPLPHDASIPALLFRLLLYKKSHTTIPSHGTVPVLLSAGV